MIAPLFIVGYEIGSGKREIRRITAVSFNIRFVDNIKSEMVGNLDKNGVGRIVRGTHCVYVKLLHKLGFVKKFFRRNRIAVALVRIVMVYALYLDRLVIEKENAVFDGNLFYTDFLSDTLHDFAVFDNFYISGV